jgi:hypothetical protein
MRRGCAAALAIWQRTATASCRKCVLCWHHAVLACVLGASVGMLFRQVFFDVGVASKALKNQEERMLGSKSVIPDDAEPIGRIVIGAC